MLRQKCSLYPSEILALAVLDPLRNDQLRIVEFDDNRLERDPQLFRRAPASMPIDNLVDPVLLRMPPNLDRNLLTGLLKRALKLVELLLCVVR